MQTRWLPVQLPEEEIKIKGEELAKAVDSHTKLEEEKKNITADYGKRLKESSSEIRKLAKVVETGKEYRDVPVKHEYFPGQNLCKVYREDTGELVEARSMTAEEYQLEFFDEEEIIFDGDDSKENHI